MQVLLLSVVAVICISRHLFAPYALLGLVAAILILHCTSGILAMRGAQQRDIRPRTIIQTLLFIAIALTCTTALFFNKATVLGINLYYIPSTSMQPALEPGDIILVDTWTYRSEAPTVGDIATFHDPLLAPRTLIKRVADIRGSAEEDMAIFFRGDNANHSSDSRYFGWVPVTDVTGRYVCTLPCVITD